MKFTFLQDSNENRDEERKGGFTEEMKGKEECSALVLTSPTDYCHSLKNSIQSMRHPSSAKLSKVLHIY